MNQFFFASLFLVAALCVPLKDYPHLRCSACLAIATEVGYRMNETAKKKTSFQASHRLDVNNKVKRIDYEASELRAVEILDGICAEIGKKYQLRVSESGTRRFSNDSLPRAEFYGKEDKRKLRGHQRRLREICAEITDEKDELIIELIKTLRHLDTLSDRLCVNGFRLCDGSEVRKSIEKEHELHRNWQARKTQRAADAAAKKAAEEAKKKADEKSKQERTEHELEDTHGSNGTEGLTESSGEPKHEDL
jgi:hypothetical protein